MDDPLLVGVLDRLTHRHEQFEPLVRGKLAFVAELRDRHALHQFHDEVRARFVQTTVEHLGNVRVIHQRERLPFGIEARQHGFRVHAGLDELHRHKSLHGFRLLRPPDGTHAALADGLHERVLAGDHRAGERGRRIVGPGGVGRTKVLSEIGSDTGRIAQEAADAGVHGEQFLDLGANGRGVRACLGEVRGPLVGVFDRERLAKDRLHIVGGGRSHLRSP